MTGLSVMLMRRSKSYNELWSEYESLSELNAVLGCISRNTIFKKGSRDLISAGILSEIFGSYTFRWIQGKWRGSEEIKNGIHQPQNGM